MALTTNLVSYYKLDESSGNATDSVGSNTLTNNNTITYSTGKLNNGADFGTTNTTKYFNKTDTASLSITGDITISAWIKPGTAGANKTVCSKYNTTGDQRSYIFDLTTNNTAASCSMIFYVSQLGTSSVDVLSVTPTIALTIGSWTHVVCKWTASSSTAEFYINGVSQGTSVGAKTAIFDSTADFELGSWTGGSWYANGMIDEVGIWSRALSAGEVSQLYNGGSGSQYAFTDVKTLDILTLGGGGGGGDAAGKRGGGGGSGYVSTDTLAAVVKSYTVTIGAGGAGSTGTGTTGGTTSFDVVTSTGGIGGNGTSGAGGAGGSGGGGYSSSAVGGAGGSSGAAGETKDAAGGSGSANASASGGGGGGGSGGTRSAGGTGTYGNGGQGVNDGNAPDSAANGTGYGAGGGGGGGSGAAGGDGSAGLCRVVFLTSAGITATGGTITTEGSNTVHTFTSSGTFQITSVTAIIYGGTLSMMGV